MIPDPEECDCVNCRDARVIRKWAEQADVLVRLFSRLADSIREIGHDHERERQDRMNQREQRMDDREKRMDQREQREEGRMGEEEPPQHSQPSKRKPS